MLPILSPQHGRTKEEQIIAEELRSTGTVIQRTLPFACRGMLGSDPRQGGWGVLAVPTMVWL